LAGTVSGAGLSAPRLLDEICIHISGAVDDMVHEKMASGAHFVGIAYDENIASKGTSIRA